MICPQCYDGSGESVPMETKAGSENGLMSPQRYVTEEIKICPECGLQVKERYEATWILPSVQIEPKKQQLP